MMLKTQEEAVKQVGNLPLCGEKPETKYKHSILASSPHREQSCSFAVVAAAVGVTEEKTVVTGNINDLQV